MAEPVVDDALWELKGKQSANPSSHACVLMLERQKAEVKLRVTKVAPTMAAVVR